MPTEPCAISIHALLAESDLPVFSWRRPLTYFYPRSPCGERRSNPQVTMHTWKFLSTLSLRRATFACRGWLEVIYYFYPRSPCGERPRIRLRYPGICAHFYPRSPCGERLNKIPNQGKINQFLSTLSLRRATPFSRCVPMMRRYFYPRSPCGERPPRCRQHLRAGDFYPRSPCGERPVQHSGIQKLFNISIHALLAESDCRDRKTHVRNSLFLSTLSLRRATYS